VQGGHWDQYVEAYEDTIRNTATDQAPWYVVPADHERFTCFLVAAAILDGVVAGFGVPGS
jgi:polyphosphate kinase 2 (PPK2 family)